MGDYKFKTVWEFDAPLEKVYRLIYEAERYPQWWKGQLKAEKIVEGDADGVGTVMRFTTRALLPYQLTFDALATAVEPLKRIAGVASGELVGDGIWLFAQQNGMVKVTYLWNVKTTTFFMNLFSPFLKPVYKWNHNLVMKWGKEGMEKELKKVR